MTEYDGVERSTATETFRAMLDERGAEWKAPASYDGSTKYDTIVDGYWFHENNGKITVHGLTPEQAVEATLGAGTLSASQVSNAVYAHSIHADCADADWQAIADELNATLGQGTCKVEVLNTGDCAGYECSEYIMHCNECGHEFGHVLYNEDGDVWMSEPPNFCPNCGRRVEVDDG